MSLKDLNVAIHTVFCKNTRRATCNKLATETGNSASMYSQRGAISIGQSMLVFSVWKQTAVTYWCPPGIVFTSLLNHPSMTIWNCVEWHNSVQKRSSCSVLFRPRDRRGLEMRSSSGWWQAGLKREKGQLWHSRTSDMQQQVQMRLRWAHHHTSLFALPPPFSSVILKIALLPAWYYCRRGGGYKRGCCWHTRVLHKQEGFSDLGGLTWL